MVCGTRLNLSHTFTLNWCPVKSKRITVYSSTSKAFLIQIRDGRSIGFLYVILRPPNTGLPALRTSPRPGKTLSFFKCESTFQTPGWMNEQLFPLGGHGSSNVVQVPVNLFFHNPDMPGDLNSVHRAAFQA
jgi:hypothetical protein